MLAAENIKKCYGGAPVLDGVSFGLAPGEKTLLLGRNGAGKTTLLRVLAGLLAADDGAVRLGGHDLAREPAAARRALGYVGHSSMLYRDLSVEDNLRFYAQLYGVGRAEAERRIAVRLEEAGLSARRRERVACLSHGQVRRLAIVRALLPEPPLLLLDEPFATLDVEGRAWLAGLLAAERARTVLLSTHQLDFEPAAADRLLTLCDGRIVDGAA